MDKSSQQSTVNTRSGQIFARYVGDGSAFINGIPACDLTREEFDALGDELCEQIRLSKLYDIAESEPKARAATIKE